jgi:hypothetical protein
MKYVKHKMAFQALRVARWRFFIWVDFGGLGMENVCIFYGHFKSFTAIVNILCVLDSNLVYFGILFLVYLVHFTRFGTLCREKSDNPEERQIKISALIVKLFQLNYIWCKGLFTQNLKPIP